MQTATDLIAAPEMQIRVAASGPAGHCVSQLIVARLWGDSFCERPARNVLLAKSRCQKPIQQRCNCRCHNLCALACICNLYTCPQESINFASSMAGQTTFTYRNRSDRGALANPRHLVTATRGISDDTHFCWPNPTFFRRE